MGKKIFGFNRSDVYKDLFYKEEFEGDKLVNKVRFYFVAILLLLALIKAGLFTKLVVSTSLIFTLMLIAASLSYCVILFLLYRKNIYHPLFKYISVAVDITLVVLSIYSYKLEPFGKYSQIYFLGRYSIIFVFIIFAILRYSFTLSVFAGAIAGIEYYALIIYDNYMTDLEFKFIGPDNVTYVSRFLYSEALLKVVYLFLTGIMLGLLALKVKKLVIDSISTELEKSSLLVENEMISVVNKENKKYLDNISEGLILIDSNYKIHDQYSKSMYNIFETENISPRNFIDFIFPDLIEHADSRKSLEKFLGILFHNTISDDDMIMEINPLVDQTISFLDPNGEIIKKVISASFYRIYDKYGEVEDVMVIFEDKTKIVEAEKELLESRNKHESEVELVAGILKIDPETLREFVEQSDNTLDQIKSWKKKLSDDEVLNKTFREIHSIKGLARTLGFRSIEKTSHSLEEVLVDIRDKRKKISKDVHKIIDERLEQILNEFEKLKDLNTKFKNFINTSIETRSSNRNKYKKLNSFFDTLRTMTIDLSKKFDKEIVLNIENSILDLPIIDKLKSSIIHLVTNSIDHGIEDNFERLSKAKPAEGRIGLKLDKLNEKYIIEVSDDGRGIDLKKIKEKALQKNLITDQAKTLTNNEAIKLMFMPGFSSKDKASEISGRGVGLDVVKDKLKKVQGKIFVTTKKDQGTIFKIELPV